MIQLNAIRERVQRGALLLDSTVPGWAGRINLAQLALNTCDECVLGQLFGHFACGKEQLEILMGRDYGFDVDCRPYDDAPDRRARKVAEYAALRLAWIAEIEARRDAVEVPAEAMAEMPTEALELASA